jgi:peptidoglycan/LPS O-acetylase OafA/YrhL
VTSVSIEARPVRAASPAAPSRRVPKFTHRPALDGLRAVAALLVTLFHADVPFLRGGFVGVDVFFVLSGFLITSLLLREIAANRRIDFVAFYARRARRLLPPAVLVLLVTAVLFHLLASPLQVALDRGGFAAAATYVSNWYFLGEAQDYFAHDQDPSPVLHYWSLSVEEQFYFVWPAVLLAIMVYVGFRTRSLAKVVVGIALVSFVYAFIVNIDEPMLSYFGTFARAYQLLLGALVAIWVFRREVPLEGPPPRVDPRLAVLAPMGFAAILLASLTVFREEGPLQLGLIAAVGTAALLVGLELNSREGLARTLSHPRLRRLGDYSYSMYLWHWPVIVLLSIVGFLPTFWPGLF